MCFERLAEVGVMTLANVTEIADFLKNHYPCNPELGITEESIF
jgi:hypothetical protein